jgi:hypothetical protein
VRADADVDVCAVEVHAVDVGEEEEEEEEVDVAEVVAEIAADSREEDSAVFCADGEETSSTLALLFSACRCATTSRNTLKRSPLM